MKHLKLILMLLFGLLLSPNSEAQTIDTNPHVICFGSTHPYRVDYTENAGAGSLNSTYVWTILTPGFVGTISTNQGAGILSNNTISINWGLTPIGDYVLEVVETTNGLCSGAPVQLTIRITPLPTASVIATTPVCSGGDAEFELTGTPNAVILYNINGGASQTVTLNSSGTATVTVTGISANQILNLVSAALGTCSQTITGSDTVTIISLPTAGVASLTPICSGDNATFTITGTPNGIVTYNINGGSNQTATINTVGTATVTVSGATANQTLNLVSIALGSCSSGLTETASVIVNILPTASVLTPSPICSGSNASFTLSGTANAVVTYSINGGANQTITLSGTGSATVSVTGATANQSISLISAALGTCSQNITGSETVVVNPLPTASVIATTPVCSGGDAEFELTGTPNAVITFNINGGASQTVTLNSSGNATVTVTGISANQILNLVSAALGTCSQTITGSDTVTIISLPTAVVDPVLPICSGDNATFTITGTPNGVVTYNINGGASQTVTISAGGTASIPVLGATVDQTLNLISISLGTCSNSLIGTSSTITVTPTPTTSPIFHD
jgi:hypothetical protein